MSADGKGDTGNLNKDEKSSTATHSEGIPVTSTVDENIVPSKTDTDQAALLTPASKADLPINDDTETNDEEIETIIEKKLPIEKDKGLDVDSELDFELKWDDDTDLLDDTDKEIESTLTSTDEGVDSTSKNTETAPTSIEKDLDSEKDIESILTSTDEGLDSVTKDLESSTTTSNLKDLDNEERATESILASIDDALDSDGKDVGTTLTSIDKAIDNADEEIQATAISTDQDLKHVEDNKEMTITSTVKGLSSTSQETEVDSEKFGSKVDDKVETNTALDTNIMDVDKVADEGQNKSDVVVHSDELKNADVSEKDTKTFENNATTIDLDTKVSPNESEANSLDEELVYSDAEVPDIEDNDLLDEIDSQLTDIKENIDELEILDTEKIQALPEPSAAQENSKENETKQKNLVSDMDVDTNLIDSTHTTEKSDLNDTWASGTDMETSSYNINNEHKLDRPDVMLEIPTQEFIESFDDSGETSDTTVEDKDKVKQSDILANKPDVVEYSTLKENSAESQTSVYKTNVAQSVSDKDDNPKSPCDTLIKDKVENTVDTNKSADDFAVVDKMDVDISATSEEAIKQHEENPKVNPNEEKAKLNQEKASAIEETLTHAETVLEKLNQDNLVPTEEKISEGDIILEAKSEQPKDKDLDKSSPTEETDVDKEGGDKPSEDQHLKEVQSKHKDIDVAQPSTSKDHQELSDEDQETTDSLGLLAESSRVMDDEDEQEPENDEDDDDDDFDQDDESNQMTAEHSEDSNAQHSESDVPKESTEIDESNDAAEPQVDDATDLQEMETDNVDIHEADTVDIHEADTVDIQEADTVDENEAFDDTHVVDDESIADKEDFQIQIGGIVSEKAEETEEMEESVELTVEAPEIIEAQKAVEALLEDKPAEEVESSDAPEPAAKIEEVKPPEDVGFSAIQKSRLRALLLKDSSDSSNDTSEAEQKSPARAKDVDISKQQEINIVELEESSEDDVQVYKPDDPVAPSSPKKTPAVPTTVDVSASEEESSDFEKKEEKVAPKPAEVKQAKLDAEEVKTASPAAEAPALPETMAQKTPETRPPIDLGEIFSLDSDDEDTADKTGKRRKRHFDTDKSKDTNNCINDQCDSDASVPLVPASSAASIYYAANAQRGSGLCLNCAQRFEDRSKKLIEGVKDFTPYLNMDMCTIREELVEISDSDSDDDAIPIKKDDEIIGEKGAKLLEEQLADMFNDTWKKYDMEARLLAAQDEISLEVLHLEEECKKIDAMLHDCQTETDKLRNDLYDTFADERRELPSICIIDTPINQWSGLEETLPLPVEIKEAKRGLPAPDEPTAKRPAIPLGYAPLDANKEPSREAKRGLPAPAEPTAKRPAIPLGYAPLDANKEPSREAKRGLPAPAEPTAKRPAIPLGYAPLDANKEPSREAKRGLPAPAEPTAKRPAIPLGYAPLDANKEPSREAKRGLPAPAEPTAKRPAIPLGYAPLDANKEPSREAKRGLPAPAEPTAKRPAIPLGYAPLDANKEPSREAKRGLPAPAEPTAKRPAIPLGYAPLDANKEPDKKPTQPPAEVPVATEDDNADISVVKLSVESAPAGLPPPGVATRPPLKPNMYVYAMRNTFGAWHKVKIVEVHPKINGQFTMCRVRFEHPKTTSKVLPARCLAYEHAPDVRLTIGTRVVALFKDHRNLEDLEKKEAYYSGIVAEIPNPVNKFRYLIFFDDGYAQYVQHAVTRLVCECAPRVWDEVHPLSRQFVRDYLRAYPERPMVRLHAGQNIKTEWNGRWWPSTILQVDASLVHVSFDGKKEAGIDKTEWIYRGSTRLAPLFLELQAAERQRSRPLPRAQGRRFNMPYVEYTRTDEPADSKPAPPESPVKPPAPTQSLAQTQAQIEQEIRRQRAVAKKSTHAAVAPPPQPVRENVTSRVVYYSPKNAIKPHKWVPHTCGPQCKRTDVLALKDLRTYNPLTKPLLSGWERHTLRFRAPQSKTAMYRAPCGRRIRNHRELHQYLQAIDSDMSVDLFDFNGHTHCLAEFVLNKCIVSKKDLSHGKENVPVPCVNYYDDSLPEFCSYNTERTPTAGVPLNLDPEFLCGCDCTDDCADKSKCACWKMTLEGARTIGLDTNEVGYVYKRLPEPLPSGIYECNSRCKCRQTCLNRVAQHPLQLKLQVFKTANRGWGIRALNDVPKGAFLCVYAGNLLTDATANLDGLNEGDEYLAELDYIEVVEQMKEGFEEDIPDDAKKADQEDESTTSASSDEEPQRDADDDFRPALPAGPCRVSEYSKRLRKRDKSKKAKENEEKGKKAREDKDSEDCITISDDEELREPARFAAQTGMGGKEFVSKYKSVRTLFGKDEACYIMDAKVQGNIGRYLNHSCTPNVFVQNVFVDTHDPRFPWVAFFALSHIKAGTELTWNYNYDVGSVPGKVLYCYCNAPNCRGRLL